MANHSIPLTATRICKSCKRELPISEMKKDRRYKHGIGSRCKRCNVEKSIAWQRANPEKAAAINRQQKDRNIERTNERRRERNLTPEQQEFHRRRNLWRLYKLTPEQFQEMLDAQAGCCAICGRHGSEFERGLHVDHDHKCCVGPVTCGRCIRGLLCPPCNFTLPTVEQTEWIAKATAYLATSR